MRDGLRVAVVGGGVGGLCVAQGLARSGVNVTVHERDHALGERAQGYRLHLDSRAGLALARCLPPDVWELFVATCGQPSTQFTVLNERLRVLHEEATDAANDRFAPATLATSANRQTLREILATGLGDHIRYGHELTHYDADEDVVQLHLKDGSTAEADLLIGADGVNSAVRRQYLPAAEIVDTGGRCVYGTTMLDNDVLALIPASLRRGFTAIVGGQIGMATGLMIFRERPDVAGAASPIRATLSPAGDYLMWAVSAQLAEFPADDEALGRMDPAELHETAASMIRTWHPNLRELVARATVEQSFLVRIRSSVPIEPWQPTRVTVLGDAIHAMSPARGSGANTALQDAGVLCRVLEATASGARDGATLVTAVGDYEQQMREYGYAAVAASREAEAEMGSRRKSLWFWLFRHLGRRA